MPISNAIFSDDKSNCRRTLSCPRTQTRLQDQTQNLFPVGALSLMVDFDEMDKSVEIATCNTKTQ